MNRQTTSIITNIAEDALTLAQWIIEKQGLVDSLAIEDLGYTIAVSDNVMIELLFNDYIAYIESSRKPGANIPPISAIRNWALRKNIPTDNNTLYAIAKAIARDGIAPRPIMDLLVTELERAFENEWSADLFEYIVGELQAYFDE